MLFIVRLSFFFLSSASSTPRRPGNPHHEHHLGLGGIMSSSWGWVPGATPHHEHQLGLGAGGHPAS